MDLQAASPQASGEPPRRPALAVARPEPAAAQRHQAGNDLAGIDLDGVQWEAPRVRWIDDLGARLERVSRRASAARQRLGPEGTRRSAPGAGLEFAGQRPYRAGEDARGLDWAAWARSGEPFVRLTRREVGARWRLALDATSSMGLGQPGKLSTAAHVALGLAAVARRLGIEFELCALRGAAPRVLGTSRTPIARLRSALDEITCARGVPSSWEGLQAGRFERVFALTDLSGAAGLLRTPPSRAGLDILVLMARHEVDARGSLGGADAVVWLDRARGERIACALEAEDWTRYALALERALAELRQRAQRSRAQLALALSDEPFEAILARLLGFAAFGR